MDEAGAFAFNAAHHFRAVAAFAYLRRLTFEVWARRLFSRPVALGTKLDGLCFAITVDFPGPLHEGNGTIQPIIDERATPEQCQALFDIFSGKHSAEGTLFHIVSLIVTKIHDPVFAPFEFSFDKDGRVAKLVARGVLETEVEPIKNPVTGAPHRIQVVMPEGLEHRAAEVASANIRSTGAIPFETHGTHSSLANVVQTPDGVAA